MKGTRGGWGAPAFLGTCRAGGRGFAAKADVDAFRWSGIAILFIMRLSGDIPVEGPEDFLVGIPGTGMGCPVITADEEKRG